MLSNMLTIAAGVGLYLYGRATVKSRVNAPRLYVDGAEALAKLRANFPGRKVGPADFAYIRNRLHRVNSDGTAVDLGRWDYRPESGEFLWIKKRVAGSGLVTGEPYNKRVVAYLETRAARWWTTPAAVLFGLISLALWRADFWMFTTAFENSQQWERNILGIIVFFGAALVSYLTAYLIYGVTTYSDRARMVGPEPLPFEPQDYGEEVGAGLGRQMGAAPARPYNPMD
jgi:hypothetical protein